MSRFYVSAQGNRGETTRGGSAGSGITAHPRGWSLGVKVDGYASGPTLTRDAFRVSVTGGSNGGRLPATIAEVQTTPDGTQLTYVLPDGKTLTYLETAEGWQEVAA